MSWDGAERRGPDPVLLQLTKMDSKLDNVGATVTELKTAVQGTNGTPGLRIRVDRLEQSKKRDAKYHAVWGTAVLGVICTWIADAFNIFK